MYRRVNMGCPVTIRAGCEERQGTCLDISGSGTAIELREPLATGATVELRLDLPNGRVIEAPAEVLGSTSRQAGVGVALRFLRLSQPSLVGLHQTLADARTPRRPT